MNAQIRVQTIRLWRDLSAIRPDKYRVYKVAGKGGQYQLEEQKEGVWVPISNLPVFGTDNKNKGV